MAVKLSITVPNEQHQEIKDVIAQNYFGSVSYFIQTAVRYYIKYLREQAATKNQNS